MRTDLLLAKGEPLVRFYKKIEQKISGILCEFATQGATFLFEQLFGRKKLEKAVDFCARVC